MIYLCIILGIIIHHFYQKTYKVNQAKNKQMVNMINDALIDWRNNVKIIPKNENSDKITDIAKKNLWL